MEIVESNIQSDNNVINSNIKYVIPGDILGSILEYNNGVGCYILNNNIISTLYGQIIINKNTNNTLNNNSNNSSNNTSNNTNNNSSNNTSNNNNKDTINVISILSNNNKDIVIEINDIILGRVIKLNINNVIVEILSVNDKLLRIKSRGTIRREDIRLNEVDTLVIHECFRPGDIVRALVISLGDARQYFLSTAEAEFGVRWAKSEKSGQPLIPLSWKVCLLF